MISAKKYARILELLCMYVALPIAIFLMLYRWLLSEIPIVRDISDMTHRAILHASFGCFYRTEPWSKSFQWVARLLGIGIDFISISLLVIGALYFIRILRLFQHNKIFSPDSLRYFMMMSRIALIWAIFSPIKFTLLSFVTTMFDQFGCHLIAFGITSNDIINIIVAGLFVILTSLMHEATELKHEHDLTI